MTKLPFPGRDDPEQRKRWEEFMADVKAGKVCAHCGAQPAGNQTPEPARLREVAEEIWEQLDPDAPIALAAAVDELRYLVGGKR